MNHRAITIGMVIASFCSAAGLIAFCFVGLVATELMLIPQEWRLRIVVVGAAAVAVGAEGGSLFSLVAAFEREGRLRGWDIIGAIVSQTATVLTIVFAFRALSGGGSTMWGYVANTVAVSMDATFNYVALGLHLRNGRALQLAEKQAALDYHRQATEIERQRAEIRNSATGSELANLRRQNAELTAALQTANAELDATDRHAAATGAPQIATEPPSPAITAATPAIVATTPAIEPPQTATVSPNGEDGAPLRRMTAQEWRAMAITGKPTTAAEVNRWLAENGYEQVPETTARRWAKM